MKVIIISLFAAGTTAVAFLKSDFGFKNKNKEDDTKQTKLMKPLLLLILLTVNAHAGLFDFGTGGTPGGFSVWHNDHWDVNGIHQDPVATPEPSPPLVLLTVAGFALLMRRVRK